MWRRYSLRRGGLQHGGLPPLPWPLSLSSAPATLLISARFFIQGGPPIPKKDLEKKRKKYLISSHEDEMDDLFQRRQQEIDDYYATHEPNCPRPLPNNAFRKGEFGMRRRIHLDRRRSIDSVELDKAVSEGNNAMKK